MKKYSQTIALSGKSLSLGYIHQKVKKEILSDLDFALFSSELTCLLGPNGVGKSTLIKAILGQIHPWKGSIQLDQQSITDFSLEELAKRIAVVLTDPVFPGNMTVGQLVALGRTPHTGWSGKLNPADHKIVEKALSDTKITYLRDERLSEISDGQRQKAMIARALAQDGQVMILDEPTAALGPHETQMVAELIQELKAQGLGIFLIEHDIHNVMKLCDRASVMKNGQLVGTVNVDEVTDEDILGMIILGKKPAKAA